MELTLIKRVQRDDDHAAFAVLMKQYQSPVRSFLRRLTTNNNAIADELAQETFIKAYLNIESYRGEGRFLSWLFQIAYREFASRMRKKTEETGHSQVEQAVSGSAVQQIEASKSVNALLDLLKEDEKACLLLHYSHELNHAEVAEVMRMPLGTVKSLIRRSKQKLHTLSESPATGDQDDK